jgi:hypothetical protein
MKTGGPPRETSGGPLFDKREYLIKSYERMNSAKLNEPMGGLAGCARFAK